MKKTKLYIFLLLFCIFFQNSLVCINLFINYYNSQDSIFVLFKKAKEIASSEDENEENEKESKEENKEESKEKEKEFKNIKYLSTFTCLSPNMNVCNFYSSVDAEIFSLNFEIETPPPKYITEA